MDSNINILSDLFIGHDDSHVVPLLLLGLVPTAGEGDVFVEERLEGDVGVGLCGGVGEDDDEAEGVPVGLVVLVGADDADLGLLIGPEEFFLFGEASFESDFELFG